MTNDMKLIFQYTKKLFKYKNGQDVAGFEWIIRLILIVGAAFFLFIVLKQYL